MARARSSGPIICADVHVDPIANSQMASDAAMATAQPLVRNRASVISPSETLIATLTTSPQVMLPSAPNPSGALMSPAYWGL